MRSATAPAALVRGAVLHCSPRLPCLRHNIPAFGCTRPASCTHFPCPCLSRLPLWERALPPPHPGHYGSLPVPSMTCQPLTTPALRGPSPHQQGQTVRTSFLATTPWSPPTCGGSSGGTGCPTGTRRRSRRWQRCHLVSAAAFVGPPRARGATLSSRIRCTWTCGRAWRPSCADSLPRPGRWREGRQ